ncbi:hypothetical protein QLX67_12690 [Balneolaceae bacterium ANBcel3]|nr:hypothetical protein [Balneolaceae bacterium ANBcel3]
MAYGQTILTIAAVILFSIHAMTAHRLYNMAVERSVETQELTEAIDFGRALNDRVQAYSLRYWTLMEPPEQGGLYGLNDPSDPNGRLEFHGGSGQVFYATVEIGNQEELMFKQEGRMVTVRVFKPNGNNLDILTTYTTAVIDARRRNLD